MQYLRKKTVGEPFTIEAHNAIIDELQRLQSITGVQDSNIQVQNTPTGVVISDTTPFAGVNLVPAKMTSEDSGGAGLHQFTEVNWDGTAKDGGAVFEDCWCVGDFSKAWDLDANSFGLVFTARDGQNAVILLPYPGNAYYYA